MIIVFIYPQRGEQRILLIVSVIIHNKIKLFSAKSNLEFQKKMKNFKNNWTFLFRILIHQLVQANEINWYNELIEYIRQNSKFYQITCILGNPKNLTSTSDEIIRKIPVITEVPILIHYAKQGDKNFIENKKIPEITFSYRSMTLFIIIDDQTSNNKFLLHAIDYISRLSENRIRPRCLIIKIRDKKATYNELLKYLWSKKYLDATIIKVFERNERRIPQRISYQQEETHLNTTIHNFNPFRNIFTEKGIPSMLSEADLFPEKLQNLYGRKMNVGIFHRPPFINVRKNSSGHVLEAFGSEMETAKLLSQRMKFVINIVQTLQQELGHFSCKTNLSNGIIKGLIHNKIQFSITSDSNPLICHGHLLEWTRSTKKESLVLIVPVLHVKNFSFENKWEFFIDAILMVLFFVIIKIAIVAMNFNWKLLNILAVVLGVASSNTPKKIAERILFGCILIVSIIYSIHIYDSLTEISLKTLTEVEYETLKDLYNSDL